MRSISANGEVSAARKKQQKLLLHLFQPASLARSTAENQPRGLLSRDLDDLEELLSEVQKYYDKIRVRDEKDTSCQSQLVTSAAASISLVQPALSTASITCSICHCIRQMQHPARCAWLKIEIMLEDEVFAS